MNNRKLISELVAHESILKATEEGNGHTLVSALLMHLPSPDDLHRVDSHGKSLLTIIQESSIDINKKTPVKYMFGEFNLTPLEKVFFTHGEDQTHPPFDQLRMVLALGANVNKVIDSEGNTFLHKYVKRRNAHPTILRDLLETGGDFLKKNDKGEIPIGLMHKQAATFIKRLLETHSVEQKSAIKIQRKWRLHLQKESKSSQSSVVLVHQLLNKTPEEPSSNSPNKEEMQKWIDKHEDKDKETAKKVIDSVQHISHKHFLFGLKMATKKFNKYILSLPNSDRNYVLLVDYRDDKSSWWVTKLAEKFLAIKPQQIISTEDFLTFKPSNTLRHAVLFDDASYSGNFFSSFLSAVRDKVITGNEDLMNLKLHLVIPFMSEESQTRFKGFDVEIHNQETIPNFKVQGTQFTAKTATYFDHKIPDKQHSTIACIDDGKLVDGKDSNITFVKPITPPYKKK